MNESTILENIKNAKDQQELRVAWRELIVFVNECAEAAYVPAWEYGVNLVIGETYIAMPTSKGEISDELRWIGEPGDEDYDEDMAAELRELLEKGPESFLGQTDGVGWVYGQWASSAYDQC